jgi:L-aminopeptidase/D-esterase-like protein
MVIVGVIVVAAGVLVDARAVNRTLTAVGGIKVGHFTMAARPTGCTVILLDRRATVGVSQRGGAPATRDTAALDPSGVRRPVDAIVLAGGSAYGLDAASGTMRWLEERGRADRSSADAVPLVPAAALIDLWFGGDPRVRPGPDCGYRAASNASTRPVIEGNIGAGAGATVGKTAGLIAGERFGPMKAGIGTAAMRQADGLIVAAVVAVNAVGDVVDPVTGRIVAGVRGDDGRPADARLRMRAGITRDGRAGENTTIGVVGTNAQLTAVEARRIAEMAQDGYARAIAPIHTPADGDTVFAVGTARWGGEAKIGIIGAMAAEVMAEAIVRAAAQATASGGLPAARDLGTVPPRFRR